MKSNIRKTKDINEIRSELEAKYGKEKLKANLLKSYNKQYKDKGIPFEKAEENMLRFMYKFINDARPWKNLNNVYTIYV